MRNQVDNIGNIINNKRYIFLGILGVILIGALGISLYYQNSLDKEKEGSIFFDDAWQQVMTVANEVQQKVSIGYVYNVERDNQVKDLYKRSVDTLDMLTLDFSRTSSGAKSALLLVILSTQPEFKKILDDTNYMAVYNDDTYFNFIKKKHPKFWGAAISILEAIKAEQKGDFAKAITLYEISLKYDKKKYLHDYILISLGRNYDILNDIKNAMYYYNELLDKYPQSSWKNFAIGRVFLLKNQSQLENNK